MIQVAYDDYYSFIVEKNPDHFLASSDLDIVAGTDNYDLPADFWKAAGVDVNDGGDWYPMRPFNWGERNAIHMTNASRRDVYYRIMGSKFRLAPPPSWSGTGSVRIWYIPAPPSVGATIDGIAGFEEYIVLHCIVQYCGKTEEDATLFASQLGVLKEKMTNTLVRDDAEPDRVRDEWTEQGLWVTPAGVYPRLGRP
jgi:hypothetical protein